MSICVNPKIRDSIYMNDVFIDKNGNGYWVIGDKKCDSQAMINAKDADFFKRLIENLNGENDVKALEKKSVGTQAQIYAAVRLLEKHGFLENTETKKSYNEAESLSIKLVKKNFKDIQEANSIKYQSICKKIMFGSKILLAASIALFLTLVGMNFSKLIIDTPFTYWISYSSGGLDYALLGYLLVNLSMVVMFAIHEIFHVIVGLEKGIQPSYFSFILFLGFMPIFYIKNKNIYSLKKKDMLKVLLAGVYSNIILFFIFMDLFIIFDQEWLKILAMANLRMLFVNLVPLSLTDGYFIYTLLFNRPNLRMRFHKFLGNPKIIKEYEKRDILYIALFISTILIMVNMEIMWIIGDIEVRTIFKILFVLLVDIVYLVSLHFLDKKKFSV